MYAYERKQKNATGSAVTLVFQFSANTFYGSFPLARQPASNERSPNPNFYFKPVAHFSNSHCHSRIARCLILVRVKNWQSCQRVFRNSIHIHSFQQPYRSDSELRACCSNRQSGLCSCRWFVLDVGSIQASQRVRFSEAGCLEILGTAFCFSGFLVSDER